MASLKKFFDNREAGSLATRMRRRRFAFFLSLLDHVRRPARILDVGGTQNFWEVMGRGNLGGLRVTLLNLETQPVSGSRFESVAGDARDLSRYSDASFDVVFSNSVIEHLGPSFGDQQRMANEIRRVGQRYFVQTPNRHFPIEPHFLTPGFQFFPVSARVWAVTHFDVGWYKKFADGDAARREVESISLLTERQVHKLFPGALIYKEKFLGLTKSFVAYGGWAD
ncbi:MAG: class I SAM-dependent methyltransferase [Gemmatimonadota bacterium]|nr:class I SAM-dependent methyltransferase [Gemmatimonadota bacterium]